MIELYKHQLEAVNKMHNGCVLKGDVGSGKSITSLYYYFTKIGNGSINPKYIKMVNKVDLYIITTARKRDTKEWEKELSPFLLSKNNIYGIKVVIDSWNNIKKYSDIEESFFIFDEQKIVGSGIWAKTFIKITKKNKWVLLTATPGDTWSDYIPLFIANGYYKNRTEFLRRHAVYSRFCKYPKIERYIETNTLMKNRKQILVDMDFSKHTIRTDIDKIVLYNVDEYKKVFKDRWDIFKNEPIKDASQLCYILRRVVNSDSSRLKVIDDILSKHDKIIIFYNFNYELNILKEYCFNNNIVFKEWNGHKHEMIPNTDSWIYLVQYISGAEGWNCIETNAIVFYSQNYSYKIMKQSSGRIDRLNTPYKYLYYYYIKSKAPIDISISRALKNKKVFNEIEFIPKKYFA